MDNIKTILNRKISKYNVQNKYLIILSYLFYLLTIVLAIINFLDSKYLILNYTLLFVDFIVLILYFRLTKSIKLYYDKISTEYEYLFRTDDNFIKSELSEIFKISNLNKVLIFSFFISVILMIISLII